MTNQFTPGLEGIIAVQTSISNLDVVESRILIKGFDLIELAGKKSLQGRRNISMSPIF